MNHLFLHLLSSAIWDKPANATLFKELSPTTWKSITNMANRQSVSGLIADKALSLPQESLPPMSLRLQYIAQIQQTEALTRKMITVLGVLSEEYKEANFPFCLLKGLSVGANYPKPLLRNPGDIDLYLYKKGDYHKSKEYISNKGFDIVDGHQMHYAFTKDGVYIENHRRFTYFDNKKYDTLLKKHEEEIIAKNNFPTIKIDGIEVQQLPIEVNALFIFQHLFRHFVHAGVGFRQYSDWLLFLSKHKSNINKDSFATLAQSYALLYPMQVFARAAVKYLAASEDIFPFPMIDHNKHVDMIIEDILHSGNFGFHRPGKQRPQQRLQGMWFSYKTTIKRAIKFSSLSPQHITLLPFKKLINRIKIGF